MVDDGSKAQEGGADGHVKDVVVEMGVVLLVI